LLLEAAAKQNNRSELQFGKVA